MSQSNVQRIDPKAAPDQPGPFSPDMTDLYVVERNEKDKDGKSTGRKIMVKAVPQTINGTRLDTAFRTFDKAKQLAEAEGDAEGMIANSRIATACMEAYAKVVTASNGAVAELGSRDKTRKVVTIDQYVKIVNDRRKAS